MTNPGFPFYDEPVTVSDLTTAEIVAALTVQQRTVVLDGFARRVKVVTLAKRNDLDIEVVDHLYDKIKQVFIYCNDLMNQRVVVDDGDPTADPVVPPTYNDPITTLIGLQPAALAAFQDDFNATQMNAIIDKMIKSCRRYTGVGTWTYYSNEVK